ncbi:hypothetical protein ACERII_06180 [Evansella sp. AB-rgal1]|uniref:hypothetical protein n=1 Tax=Evansella sp. AB-rgal1 TaxID=3242696 RepID=UPI00359E8B0E
MITLEQLKREVATLKTKNKFNKMLQFSALLTEYFEPKGIKPIIVGGLSVEIYTKGHYTTHDIDLITDGWEQFNDLLTNELDFKKINRIWYHEDLEIAIEIPSSYLEGSLDKILQLQLPNNQCIYVIGIEDIIIHRLESAIASNKDHPEYIDDYDWAERMFHIHYEKNIDMNYLLEKAKQTNSDAIINKWVQES